MSMESVEHSADRFDGYTMQQNASRRFRTVHTSTMSSAGVRLSTV